MSEVSDALIIVVSEETGAGAAASGGYLDWDITRDELRSHLQGIRNRKTESKKLAAFWKGRLRNGKKTDE